MEPVRKQKKDLEGHKLIIKKHQEEKYTDNYTGEQKKRTLYTVFDETDDTSVQFTGSSILDSQDIDTGIAQTITLKTSKKTGNQYWSFKEWQEEDFSEASPRPQFQPQSHGEGQPHGNTPPEPNPSPEDDEREKRKEKKRDEARKLAREALGGDPQPEAQGEEGMGEGQEGKEEEGEQ